MKDLKEYCEQISSIDEYINEASKDTKWVAIEVTTSDHYYDDKTTTSQRVVSYDTYQEMKEKGHTKGHMSIKNIEVLSPVCRNKDDAMSYIEVKQKAPRKSKIDKGDADYIVYAISSGKMNPTGTTKWDWNFWEEWKDSEIYIDSKYGGSFLMGAPGSLKVGDKVLCVDNDSQRKLTGAPAKIQAVCKCNIEDFREAYRKLCPDICKSPRVLFGKKVDGLPWQRMGQFYSIKGVSE